MTSLSALLAEYPGRVEIPPSLARLDVSGVTADSRQAQPGGAFVAIKGAVVDGGVHIPDALRHGAAAVICAPDAPVPADMPAVRVDNPRLALSLIAAAFYGAQPARMVAVTGTDGKTSTVDFFRQLVGMSGHKAASIGTVGVHSSDGDFDREATTTTPDPVMLHRTLRELCDAGYGYAAMEASSHGLDQYRLHGVKLEAAAFTNLTRDHMDYHGSQEAYFAAKSKLFTEVLPEGKTAVLNADDAKFPALRNRCDARRIRVIAYGKSGADLRWRHSAPTLHGQQVELELEGTPHRLELKLVGGFQVMNLLAAYGLARAAGLSSSALLPLLEKLQGVPGRLQQVAVHATGAPVFVDYAHTPAALANLLRTLRPHVQNRLWVVFGCGGDRDKGKRPEMGKAAQELADSIVITDDNPRSEDPASIRAEILKAAPEAIEIGDREEAIFFATQQLQPGDVLVIAGKGHEKTQTVGSRVFPFDDAEVARRAAQER